jgi:hypothetical protein
MIYKACSECGKEFEVNDSKRNWQRMKLCSDECRKSVERRRANEKYTQIQWPQPKVCIRCNADFLVHEGGNMAQKYCTAECQLCAKAEKKAAEVELRRQAKKCECCGVAFITGKFTAHKQRFCSNECRMKDRHKRQYCDGSNNAKIRNAYKYDFKFVRPKIIERDGNKCVVCNSEERLHVHHLDNSGGSLLVNNDPLNLITMCDLCHNSIHNITLAKIDGKWVLDSKIFKLLGLTGEIQIKQ